MIQGNFDVFINLSNEEYLVYKGDRKAYKKANGKYNNAHQYILCINKTKLFSRI